MTVSAPEKQPTSITEKPNAASVINKRQTFKRGCNSCGQPGHIARFCYARIANIRRAWKIGQSFPEPRTYGCVWVPKSVLYARKSEDYSDDEFDVLCNITQVQIGESECTQSNKIKEMNDEINLTCNLSCFEPEREASEFVNSLVAYMSSGNSEVTPWYFDSGCSRHMTGAKQVLTTYNEINGGKVTFGDGGKGNVRGIGHVKDPEQPDLVNVYYVEGLKANLISISQLCDEGLKVIFTKTDCQAIDSVGNVILEGIRSGNNCYMWKPPNKCMSASESQLDLWHKRMGHMNVNGLQRIVKANVVRGVPKLEESSGSICKACCQGKQIKVQHKQVKEITSKRVLELIHMDLMGPIQTESIGGRRHIYVLVDDFSRFTWVRFLREKSETFQSFKMLALELSNEKGSITQVQSDHGGEFENQAFDQFLQEQGIRRQFAAPRTPQENGIVERKNRTLQETARAMMHYNNVETRFWAEAVSTACYIINRVYVKPGTKTTPYEIWRGKTPNLSHLHIFGCTCYILNDREHLGKFDSRSDEGVFLGYSTQSMAYRVYNKTTRTVTDAVNVVFDDRSGRSLDIVSHDGSETDSPDTRVSNSIDKCSTSKRKSCTQQVPKNHSADDVIGELNAERQTWKIQINFKEMVKLACFISLIEPRDVYEALADELWTEACHEELEQFARHEVWDLVPRPDGVNVIGTKWIFKNKIDEDGNVVRNKSRLVAQGYCQI